MLKRNILPSRGRIQAVHAAIVPAPVAAAQEALTFSGRGTEFWGFSVTHSDEAPAPADFIEYQVPTASLRDLADMVRTSPRRLSAVPAWLMPL